MRGHVYTVADQSITPSGGRLAAFVRPSLTRRCLAIEAAGLKERSEQMAAASRAAPAAQAR